MPGSLGSDLSRRPAPLWLAQHSAWLFLLTAGAGVWAAYDRPAAVVKLALIGAGLLLAYGIVVLGRTRGETAFRIVGLASGVTAVALALSFAAFQWPASGPTANALIILLPLSLGAAIRAGEQTRWISALLAGAGCITGAAALAATGERSAWMALAAGTILAIGLGQRFRPSLPGLSRGLSVGVVATSLAGVVAYAVLMFLPMDSLPMAGLPEPLLRRLSLWQDTLPLIEDYFYTGSGLGETGLVFSSYVLLLHVPFQPQAHNLFLQIAMEQGVPGLIAFLGMIAAAGLALAAVFRESRSGRWDAAMTTASLGALCAYGMLDSEVYVSGLAPLLFVPVGGAWALAAAHRSSGNGRTWRGASRVAIPVAAGLALLAVVLVGRAQFLANLGAVAQTRAEMAAYTSAVRPGADPSVTGQPVWGVQDEIRRNGMADLSPALQAYHSVLDIDPGNPTANRRLGQIELSLGDYAAAGRHLEAAYRREPGQRATRQLLGEVYAITGNAKQAVALWRTVDTRDGQLEIRRWWYERIGAREEAAHLREALSLFQEAVRRAAGL